jgi:Tfp pilus assembly protein PilN
MIQFNLLPDIKLEYVKSERTKRVVVAASVLVSAGALFLLILMFLVVNVFQKKHMSDVNKDIKSYSTTLQNTKDLAKILTVQNQLQSLPNLHEQKPVTSRLFGYLSQVVSAQVNIAKLEVDFDANTMTFTGTADSLNSVNTFVDTLKFTTYETEDGSITGKSAFTSVVLSEFTRTSDKGASYTITLNFSPDIFDVSKDVKLVVPPGKITTRSETEKPNDLFQPLPINKSGQ